MSQRSKHLVPVVVALSVLLLVASAVVLRARARSVERGPAPPAATVPAPTPVDLARLEVPCWSCREASEWPLRSRLDLDLVAPLGDGAGNAALFLRDFARESGRRRGELERARAEMIDGPADLGRVFPPDHPLLLEAEPWTEQATLQVYPALLPLDGWDTEIPDLTFALELARSWVARGRAAHGERALEDYRRAVRLGRLLRQEDTTVIADLVGLGCLRLGLQAIYTEQLASRNLEGALAAAIALGELAPQRLLTSERITRVDVTPFLSSDRRRLDLPAERIEPLVRMAESDPDRRFRGEAVLELGIVAHLGGGEVQARATRVLETLRHDGDERIALLADWSLTHPPGAEALGGTGTP